MLLTIDELCYRTGMSVKEFIERGATNFKFWVESLFDYKIEPFHLEWVSLFYNNKRSCVIAARQHGKSSVLGPLFHLWMAFYEENKNFMIVSHNLPLSTRHIRDMRNMIAEVELLQYRLEPEDKRRSWTKTEIETATGCKIFCKPYSDNVRGYAALHYCLIDEASYLEDHLIFERAILPMLSHYDGNLMLAGTPKSEYDLLAKAQLPNSGFVVKRYPAITEEGKPLWPEKFPMSKLERIRREIGELAFAREYLCTLRGSKERALPPEVLIKSMDENLRMENVGEEGGEYFVGVDLAASPIGDYTVFTVVRKKDGKFVVSRIERYRGIDYKTQCRLIESLYNRFKPRAVLIDKSSFGDMLINELRVEYNVPCEGVAFNPQSRNMLLTKMINLFLDPQGSRVVIPRDANDPYTISLTDVLIHELSGLYPDKTRTGLDTYKTVTKHDDTIASLALALYAAEQTRTARVYVRAQ